MPPRKKKESIGMRVGSVILLSWKHYFAQYLCCPYGRKTDALAER